MVYFGGVYYWVFSGVQKEFYECCQYVAVVLLTYVNSTKNATGAQREN